MVKLRSKQTWFCHTVTEAMLNELCWFVSATANPLSHCWIQGAVPRIRSAFEKALGASSSSSNPMLRFGGTSGEMPCLALTMTPSFWTDHLRLILWSAYMAFEWTLAGVSASSTSTPSASDFDAHRKQRSAFKAIFYRAVEDLPWAKVDAGLFSFRLPVSSLRKIDVTTIM